MKYLRVVVVLATLGMASTSVAHGLTADTDNFRTEVSYCVQSAPPAVGVGALHAILLDVVDEWNSAAALTHDQALTLSAEDHGANCTADVKIISAADVAGLGGYNGTNIRLKDAPAFGWSTSAQANKYNIHEVLVHEIGHSFGVSHSGKALWYNTNASEDPSMFTLVQLGSDALTTIEISDWAGAAIVESLGEAADSFVANPGFEAGKKFGWSQVGVAIHTCTPLATCTKSGDYRAKVDATGGWLRTRETYDPWKVVDGSKPVVQDGMTANPTIGYSAWVKDANQASGSGYVKIYRDYRRFEYNGEEWKGKSTNDPDWDGPWAGWWLGDWVAPSQSWIEIGDSSYLSLSKTTVGGIDYVQAVVYRVKVVNDHNSRVLVDQVELTGGFVEP